MTTLQSLDKTGAQTTEAVMARLASAEPARATTRPALRCAWVIDATSGRPVSRWVAE